MLLLNKVPVIDVLFVSIPQEKLLELKEDQQRAEMDLKEVTKENESLKGPLKVAQNTVEELSQKMTNYVKDKQRLTVNFKKSSIAICALRLQYD